MAKGDVITDKQFKMVAEYFRNGYNKEKAMLAAGYAESTARNYQHATFAHACVQAEIRKWRKSLHDEANLDRGWIIRRYMALADAAAVLAQYKKVDPNGQLYWDFKGATEEELKLVNGLTTDTYSDGRGEFAREVKKMKIDISDPVSVLNSLARIEGLFNDKLHIEGEASITDILQEGRKRSRAAEAAKKEDTETED